MIGNILNLCRKYSLTLLLFGLSNVAVFSQNSLSGLFNQPSTHVETIGTDRVTVSNITGFAIGDTILLIQMQGVKILTASTYGSLQQKAGEPGLHEFLIIQGINIGIRQIIFSNNTLKTYDPAGNIQIIRVPYYNSAVVAGRLTCAPWDSVSKSGGVLTMIVGTTLTLNADIDVSEMGFNGGKDTIGDGICWNTNTTLYGREYYARSFTNAGFKGEGVANLSEFDQVLGKNFAKGLGNNWTGGGGGNARYSGGGGGANRGAGGPGGLEDGICFPNLSGGNGGSRAFHGLLSDDRIYMGGGGGASTTSPTGSSSNGGKGGGIVIIVANAMAGNGGRILANGGHGGNESGIGGSGGGGAGGSIALSLNSYGASPLAFSLMGGNGGNNPGTTGEGGGGGGGLLYVSTDITPNVTNVMTGGLPGNNTTSTAGAGADGEKRLAFKAILNGFLFNTIISSATGNQVDAICSNMLIPKILGTTPIGGNAPYTYLWEKSYDQVAWIPLTNDPDPVDFTPSVIETATVWFRRTITSSMPDALVDVSKSVQFVVQPFIKNNIVGTSDTICFAQNPHTFTSQAALQDGNGVYAFNWEVSQNNSVFNTPANTHNTESYTPAPALTATSWYRRTVTSGRCIDSSAIAKITVLDTLRNNKILNFPADICFGMQFNNLSATTSGTTPALIGGDAVFIYKWESNLNGAGWTTAPGASNSPGYNPVELPQRTPDNEYIFRRVVYSGSNNVCSSVSNAVLLKDFPVIVNNNISPVPPICSGSLPGIVIGSITPVLTGGNLIYSFSWQDSSRAIGHWTNIAGATNPDYQHTLPLTDTTFYRRLVSSNACASKSSDIRVVVHKPVLNNVITVLTGGTLQTICNNQVPIGLHGTAATGGTEIPGDYAYQWKLSADNSVFSIIPGETGLNYSPPALTSTTYYRRDVTSGACLVNSTPITVTVLPLISNNSISGNPKVCYSMLPAAITGANLSGGSGTYKYLWEQSPDGNVWSPAAAVNNAADYQPPTLTNSVKYRRNVSSGLNDCCTSVSNVFDIGIDPLPVSQINAGPDTIIYSIEKIFHLEAIAPVTGETGAWSSPESTAVAFDDSTKFNATASGLISGNNSLLWTVHRGPCKLKDSIDIELLQDFVPQGFSPNGDAWNNVFKIEGLDLIDHLVDLKIVNSAGAEVFSTSNRDGQKWVDWDGKNTKGFDLAEGTYYYMLKVTTKKGQAFKKSGFIILKRY